MKQSIVSPNAPAALGPYCHATVSGKLVFVSGTLGIDPASGKLAEGVEAPQSVHDGRDARQQVDDAADESRYLFPPEITPREQGDGKRERDAKQQGQERGEQCPHDEGKRPVSFPVRVWIPFARTNEVEETVLVEGRKGTTDQGINHTGAHQQDEDATPYE